MCVLNTENVYVAIITALKLTGYRSTYRTLIYRRIVNKDMRISCVKTTAGRELVVGTH